MTEFTITDDMKKRVKENKEGLESKNIDDMRTYGIAFCDKFFKETKGQFDTWGNREDNMFLMYVASIGIGYTIIIDGDIRRDTIDEFLSYIETLENKIRTLKKNLILKHY